LHSNHKSTVRRFRTDINHHFHYVVPSSVRDFAFLRISKSASSSIVSYPPFKLNQCKKIHASLYPHAIFCCIRNPIDRFISSIPETLLRYTVRHLSSRTWSSAVYVSEDVSARLDALTGINDPSAFLYEFIELVREGPFDAHHQPQVDFITTPNLELIRPMSFFALDKVNDAVKTICMNYNLENIPVAHKNVKVSNNHNATSNRTRLTSRLKIKAASSLYRAFNKFGFCHRNFSEPVVNKWSMQRNEVISIAREIKALVYNDHSLRSEIEHMYSHDIVLYNSLIEESSPILDLSTLKS